MSYFIWESNQWLNGALCRRHLVGTFNKFGVPIMSKEALDDSEWHWALGLVTDGQFQVVGAWRAEDASTAGRIAADLHDRGIERIDAVVADGGLVAALQGLNCSVCARTASELAVTGSVSLRMRRAVIWTDAAAQRVQKIISRAVKRHGPFVDHDAVADFLAQALQRAERDLLRHCGRSTRPALSDASAAPSMLARAA
jgi:uncharacterized Zn-binding protein involved in type VI secretion